MNRRQRIWYWFVPVLGSMTMVMISACTEPVESSSANVSHGTEAVLRTIPTNDLRFTDRYLQEIATDLARQARSRGIREVSGRNRVDCLLRLEMSLGRSDRALDRVNELVSHLVANDASVWAKMRQRAELELHGRTDEGARRVASLLTRWRERKSTIAFEYLSSNYTRFISNAEWERRFHEFIADRPIDVATWGWLLMQNDPETIRRRYGRVNAELAYRNYLEHRGVGGAREARRVFSVPGIEIAE